MKALVARGHDVTACASEPDDILVQKLRDIGVRFMPSPITRHGISPTEDIQTILAIRKLIRDEQPDRIFAYSVKPVTYTHLAGRLAGKPKMFAMIPGLGYAFGGGSLKQKYVGFIVRNMYRASLRYSSGVFFQNPDDQAFFMKKGLLPRKVPAFRINGSGVDLDWYAPAPLPDEPVFLFVARLLADKGVREFYQAACMVKEKHPQARFQMAGGLDPNPDSVQEEELKKWQSEGIIEYLGKLDDIRPAYAGARIFVLPSYYREGTPHSTLEAMSIGRPVITTDAPGCRETVSGCGDTGMLEFKNLGIQEFRDLGIGDNAGIKGDAGKEENLMRIKQGKNGFLVPVKDAHSLARAIERFILEPELAEEMGAESLRIAREKYDVHKVNEIIMQAMGV